MKKIYDFIGGKKLFAFYLVLLVNIFLMCFGKYTESFANFCIMLSGTYMVGNVGHHFAERGKDDKLE